MHMKKKQAFTLIELMIVVSVITILMLATFQLFRAAAHSKKVAETKARLERIQNALSGYFAAYGQYPPVPFYADLNPDNNHCDPDYVDRVKFGNDNDGVGVPYYMLAWEARAQVTARCVQPIAFEFPPPRSMDEVIPTRFKDPNDWRTGGMDVQSVNQVDQQYKYEDINWNTTKVFKFGLVSFLIPKLQVVGIPGSPTATDWGAPSQRLFLSAQWINQSTDPTRKPGGTMDKDFLDKMGKQLAAENEACAKWLPNLAGTIAGSGEITRDVLGIPIWTGGWGHKGGLQPRSMTLSTGQSRPVAVWVATILDAWHNEFFYYSPPPYQSYRIWSAGDDGKTYPPWIQSNEGDYLKSDKDGPRWKKIAKWKKDDIVGGDL